MITPRLTNCTECTTIKYLIDEIDCKLAKLAGNAFNNITLMLNKPIPADSIVDLLHYKRILQYKYVNSSYVNDYTIDRIASRVKILKYE